MSFSDDNFGKSSELQVQGDVKLNAEDRSAPDQIILVQNWFEALRRLVPTN